MIEFYFSILMVCCTQTTFTVPCSGLMKLDTYSGENARGWRIRITSLGQPIKGEWQREMLTQEAWAFFLQLPEELCRTNDYYLSESPDL